MALSKTTQDHDEIRKWAEARGGKPADVASTETKEGAGIIRIEFPGAVHANDSALKEISWEEFFAKFDASGLALVYQEQTADGATRNFNKLIHPENASVSAKKSAKHTPAKKSPKKASTKETTTKVPVKSSGSAAKTGLTTARKSATKSAAKKSSVPAKKSVGVKGADKKGAPLKKQPASAKKAAPAKSPTKKTPAKKGTRR